MQGASFWVRYNQVWNWESKVWGNLFKLKFEKLKIILGTLTQRGAQTKLDKVLEGVSSPWGVLE